MPTDHMIAAALSFGRRSQQDIGPDIAIDMATGRAGNYGKVCAALGRLRPSVGATCLPQGKPSHSGRAIWRLFANNADGIRELLLAQLFLQLQGEDIGADYAGFIAGFDDGIKGVLDPSAAAFLWDRLDHWADNEENMQEAERCFRHAFILGGDEFAPCLGAALNALGRFEETQQLLTALTTRIVPDAYVLFQLGVAHEQRGQLNEAAIAYRDAIVCDEDYAFPLFNLCGVLWNMGEFDRAVYVWNDALLRFPDQELAGKVRAFKPAWFPPIQPPAS